MKSKNWWTLTAFIYFSIQQKSTAINLH